MNGGQVIPDISAIVRAIVIVVVVVFFGWLLLAWAVVKRPILALPVAAFTGLVLLIGMHDAQGPRGGGAVAHDRHVARTASARHARVR
jgi:hypothetical protein